MVYKNVLVNSWCNTLHERPTGAQRVKKFLVIDGT
jgi:hypothetical protein